MFCQTECLMSLISLLDVFFDALLLLLLEHSTNSIPDDFKYHETLVYTTVFSSNNLYLRQE